MPKLIMLLLLTALPTTLPAQDDPDATPPVDGVMTLRDGLKAWDRIHQVLSHPRCSNCHVDKGNVPMWSGPSYGAARPHGMNINAGDSRIGAEYTPCKSCHIDAGASSETPHTPPRIAGSWQLAPVEAEWFGRSARDICNQLRDPARNGGRNARDLADHVVHDAFVAWGWAPGGHREPAPFSQSAHVADIVTWGAAGMPCPDD